MNAHFLSRVPLFASLPPDEFALIADRIRPREAQAQALLFVEGSATDHFYILLEGEVEIVKALDNGGERVLGIRGPGSVIGEMSLFSRDNTHTASVRARTPLRLMEMTRADFDALLQRHPGLGYEIARMLSTRLDESENLSIRELQEKNRQLTQAYIDLRAAQAQLLEQGNLEAELNVARAIQRSILPYARPSLPGFDFGMRVEPMRRVGGDFFDFIPLGDRRLGIAIGDVSDHGVPAAIFMALTYSLLRAEARRADTPGQAIRSVNRHLLELNRSGMYVTVLYGVLDGATREFNYARAGHELPMLLDARRELIPAGRRSGQILGVLPDLLLDEQSIALPADSLLLLYTDGVTEATNADREMIGVEGVKSVLRSQRAASAQEACDAIWSAVQAHSGAAAPQDDVTLVAVRVEPTRTGAADLTSP